MPGRDAYLDGLLAAQLEKKRQVVRRSTLCFSGRSVTRWRQSDRALDGSGQASDQRFFIKGLGEKAKRPSTKGASAAFIVGIGGNKYDRGAVSPVYQVVLKV
jgi:hypothetical protein